jgi:hypothetical protein
MPMLCTYLPSLPTYLLACLDYLPSYLGPRRIYLPAYPRTFITNVAHNLPT